MDIVSNFKDFAANASKKVFYLIKTSEIKHIIAFY